MMRDELRQSFALLPSRSEPRIGIAKPVESRIKKFIGGRGATAGALSVERPAKNELGRTILFSSHSAEPMVNKRGLPDPSPGSDCNDVDILVFPCAIQESDVLFSTKKIASCNRQPGNRNLLRRNSWLRLASSDTRSGRGYILQALTSDSTPPVDCICYRGN